MDLEKKDEGGRERRRETVSGMLTGVYARKT